MLLLKSLCNWIQLLTSLFSFFFFSAFGDTKTLITDDDSEKKTRNSEGIDMQVRNSHGIENAANNQAKRGMVLPFQPLSLAFNHVNYYVDMPAVSHFSLIFFFQRNYMKTILRENIMSLS